MAGASLLGIGGADLVRASKGPAVGEGLFVEAFLGHEGTPEFPVGHSDDFPRYLLDAAAGEVVVTPAAGESARRLFRSGAPVASEGARDLAALPATLFGGGPSTSLRVDPTRELVLAEPSPVPAVDLDVRGDGGVAVSVADRTLAVPSGEGRRLELDPREVAVRRRGPGTETVPDKRGGTLEVPALGEIATTEVTPVVTVLNHGTVDAFAYAGGESR